MPPPMSARSRLLLALGFVFGLYVFHVHLKRTKIYRNETWDARDETGQFWSECAFHYRFAKFFAERPASDWGQLAHDRDVQHPATINDWPSSPLRWKCRSVCSTGWSSRPCHFTSSSCGTTASCRVSHCSRSFFSRGRC